MAAERGVSLPALIVQIDAERGRSLLASACRVQALDWAQKRP
jgi:predicted DNA-binding ribbon-helix-helix protein